MEETPTVKLTLPRQDLAEFTLFRPHSAAAADWVRSLPVANPSAAGQLLGQALAELNRVHLAPENRYGILEELRPGLQAALHGLARRYLNQPLVLAPEPRRMAELADRLHALATTAYTVVAAQTVRGQDSIRDTNPARLACQAVQRALSFAGDRVLRAFQLYRPLGMHGWQVMHQLYALADSQALAALPVPEPADGCRTIKGAYLRGLLLGCAKPNKLRPGDLAQVYEALREWAELAELGEAEAGSGLFAIDLDSDQPPRYAALDRDAPGNTRRLLDTAPLIARLEQLQAATGKDAGHEAPPVLSAHLLEHLVASLGKMSQRNFSRNRTASCLRVCLGLSSTHYQVAGRRDFEQLLQGNELVAASSADSERPFGARRRKIDVWQQANPERDYLRNEWLPGQRGEPDFDFRVSFTDGAEPSLLEEVEIDLPLDQRYPIHKVPLTDASPGGYCLDFDGELPDGVKTGDIAGIKEEQSVDWVIAVIRWISRLETDRTLVGLELLSPRAIAFGALGHRRAGGKAPPMRALLLPEIKLVGQPQTLLTPRAGFRERQRVSLVKGRSTRTVQLVRQIGATTSYARFECRDIEELGDVLSRERPAHLNTPYDSLWSNI